MSAVAGESGGATTSAAPGTDAPAFEQVQGSTPEQQRDRDCPEEGGGAGDGGSSSGTSTDGATNPEV